MKRILFLLVLTALWFSVCSCSPATQPEDPKITEIPEGSQTDPQDDNHNQIESMTIKITVGSKTFTADNIDECIQYMIDNKKYEIQVLLTNYKREKIGYSDLAEKLKL